MVTIFVLGLDQENRARLEALPHDEYRFHGLLDPERRVPGHRTVPENDEAPGAASPPVRGRVVLVGDTGFEPLPTRILR